MIEVKLQEIAKRHGINNSYQLEKLTGWTPGMCARLWKKQWKRSDLKTLNTLCNLFKCTPSDLLEFTPDADES